MDGQHQYEINLKKDDLFICLSSDDVYFISKQMDKWFGILLDDSYVPVSMPQRPPALATAESVPVQPAAPVMPAPEPSAVAQPQPETGAQPEPVATAGGFIHPSQVQLPQAQPVPSSEANDLLAQQLLMQQQIAAQQQTILAQQAALQAQQAIPQPIPQPVPQSAQAQPTLQDVLQQVGQPNLPDFVNQQPALQQPSVLNAMPAQPAFQDVNLPMAQPALIQQAVQQPMPQPIPQPIAQPLPEAPLHTEVPVLQAVPQSEVQAAPQPVMQAPPQVPAEPPLSSDVAEVATQPIPQPIPQPVPELAAVGAPSLVPTGEQDDFEAVMNSLLRDFEDKPSQTPGFAAEAAAAKGVPRERIEPDLSGVTSLADLCDRSNASNSEDYLLLSAYYLSRMERQDTFSLKKVNSVLVKSGLTPVNHSVLETVLTNGYLSMLPDLTGTAEVTEYQISAEGIEAAIALL